MFCWSAKECEEIIENVGVSKRRKKILSKVWNIWPLWNESNRMTIDYIEVMAECNLVANIIIIPPSFYVENITKLAGDKKCLRKHLWPLLEGLLGSHNVQHFQSVLSDTKHAVGDVPAGHMVGRTTRSSKIKHSNTNMSGHLKLSNDGTYELLIHIVECPFTYIIMKLTYWWTMGLCVDKSRERTSNKDSESSGQYNQ